MKTAIIQLNAQADKKKNIKKALWLTERAIKSSAAFIALPEVFNYRGPLHRNILSDVAEQIPGETVNPFLALAKQKKVFILLGSVYERIKNSKKAYNTSVFIDDKGKILGKYRKTHLFNALVGTRRINESRHFLAGKKLVTANAAGFKIGMSICYDLRFPAIYQQYSRAGCHVVVVPSSFTKRTGKAHWEVLLRARAIENCCYVLAPNQVGKDSNGVFSYGNSMIVDPRGEVLARASGRKEEIIYGEITKDRLLFSRRILPSLKTF